MFWGLVLDCFGFSFCLEVCVLVLCFVLCGLIWVLVFWFWVGGCCCGLFRCLVFVSFFGLIITLLLGWLLLVWFGVGLDICLWFSFWVFWFGLFGGFVVVWVYFCFEWLFIVGCLCWWMLLIGWVA